MATNVTNYVPAQEFTKLIKMTSAVTEVWKYFFY